MQIQRKALHISRIAADLCVIISAFLFAVITSPFKQSLEFTIADNFLLFVLLLVWLFSARITSLYDEFRSRNYSFELIAVIKNIVAQSTTAIFLMFMVNEIPFHRLFVLKYSIGLLILLSLEKYVFRKVLDGLRKKGRNLRSMLIIGAGEIGQNFYESIRTNLHFGYTMVGFLDDEKRADLNGLYLGKLNILESILENYQVDDIIIALPNDAAEKVENIITVCDKYTTRIRIIPDYFRFFSQKYNASMFGRFPVISVSEEKLNELHWSLFKRLFDISFSMLLFFCVFSWLWPLLMILIKINAGGHIFYKQERWGKDNKKFVAYKFRSMLQDCVEFDGEGNFMQVTKDDPRVTRVGKFLRRTNLDELPQFLNVIKGEMSVVGPRPHPTPLNLKSRENIKGYMRRHLVKPGITGWAQVNGFRGETKDPCLMQKRVEHDLWYIENWSFWLDLQIVFMTAWNMFRGDKNAY